VATRSIIKRDVTGGLPVTTDEEIEIGDAWKRKLPTSSCLEPALSANHATNAPSGVYNLRSLYKGRDYFIGQLVSSVMIVALIVMRPLLDPGRAEICGSDSMDKCFQSCRVYS
jgi:hypothetical protein